MKVVIVNCFDTYEDRIDMVYNFFNNRGDNVKVVQSNFRHFNKVKRIDTKKDFIFVDSKPYYKNISIDRLVSHYIFAKKAFEDINKLKPDLLYVIVPPNSLARFSSRYKKNNSKVKLIFDIIDLWPETMPVRRLKKFPLFSFWKLMRDSSLKHANFVITECDLYRDVLAKQLKNIKSDTIYLAKNKFEIYNSEQFNNEEIHLCYLGSINNLIDISMIKKLISIINSIKPVTFHIIGDGESRDVLIDSIKQTNALVKYYGKIYDFKMKKEIFDRCQFGINIMKDTVCVGLTMKSIDYFQGSLPIINNIQGDTYRIVNDFGIGINVNGENLEKMAMQIATLDKIRLMENRKNTIKAFDSLFSENAFQTKFAKVIKEVVS